MTPKETPTRAEIRRHVFETYVSLRWGLAILAFLFPIGLWLIGRARYGLPMQPSLSDYFFAADATMCATFPMRSFFVGGLCAIAVGLYLYKGFSRLENYLLNSAAICGAVVAIVPMRLAVDGHRDCSSLEPLARAQADTFPLHYVAAVGMFLLLAVVAWRCAEQTLDHLPADQKPRELWFRNSYKTLALLMVAFPFIGIAVNFMLQADNRVLFVEWAGIWVFAAYWALKSFEMSLSEADFRAVVAADTAAERAGVQEPGLPAR